MTNDKRITPEEIVKAYQDTGLKIGTGMYMTMQMENKCACGMGVYFLRSEGFDKENLAENSAKHIDLNAECNLYMQKNFGTFYKVGFAHGFEEIPKDELTNLRYNQGYKDGKQARKMCQELGIEKP